MTERVPTGITGLDSLVEGGIPDGFNILVAGAPGTGKTIFGLQFIYEGVKKGEAGIYVSFEQFKEEIIEQAEQFGWHDIRNEKLFSLLSIKHKDIQSFMNYLKDEVVAKGAKRMVIDSLSVLSVYTNILEDPEHIRLMDLSVDLHSRLPLDPEQLRSQTIYHVMGKIKALGVTTLLITEQTESNKLTRDEVSEFVCDGLIVMKKVLMGKDVIRSITVEKLRQTKIQAGSHPMEFGPNGIMVK
ncbi:MAG: ATPase domain-containing protein [Candidatus Altiarchaeota archaeon]